MDSLPFLCVPHALVWPRHTGSPATTTEQGLAVKLALSDEDAAFREDIRRIYTTEIPADIRERTREGELNYPDDLETSQRILNEHGLAVPTWPAEWGGKDWTPLQSQIWLDEMQLAA